VNPRPRRFGRARHLGAKARARETALDVLYAGAWPARLARPLGLTGRFAVAEHALETPTPRPGRPALRVAFASDFHAGPSTHPALVRRACRALAEARADLVLLGGDFVGFHARHVDRLVPLLAAVEAPLGKVAVLGNHDLMADDAYIVRRLADAGVRTLVNASARLPAPHDDVWVVGLDDWNQGAPDAAAAFAGADGVRLLLMHQPDGLLVVGEDRAFDAAFCGHVHGGQFWLSPTRSAIGQKGPLSQRWLRGGVFRVGARGERWLVVSRGIGVTTLPLRRGADPQVHVCVLRAAVPDEPPRGTPDDRHA
jgi:predicted MPP superfamily phosphohydrolase